MNKLIVGLADKTDALPTKQGFLLIDDGPIADYFLSKQKRAVLFDPTKHSFNPLEGITVLKARQFADLVFPDKDLMTYRNGKRALTRMLLRSDLLSDLPRPKGDDEKEAQAVIDDLLLSPLLRDVLGGGRVGNFSFKPNTIVAKINRAEVGDHDAFILGCILISQFKGTVIVPDAGFYVRDLHMNLIRENRLIIGCNSLDELPEKIRRAALLFENKVTMRARFDDAQQIAEYEGLVKGTNAFNDFVANAIA